MKSKFSTDTAASETGSLPSFSPISNFLSVLNEPARKYPAEEDLKGKLEYTPIQDMAAISKDHASKLQKMGYTSVDQIAGWQSTDIQKVSQILHVPSVLLERVWKVEAQNKINN